MYMKYSTSETIEKSFTIATSHFPLFLMFLV